MIVLYFCIIVSVLILILLLKPYLKKSNYWQNQGVHFADSKITGSFISKIFNSSTMLDIDIRIYDKMKELKVPYMGQLEFFNPTLVVKDLDLIKSILVKDFDHFVNRREFSILKSSDPHCAKILLNLQDEDWKHLRTKISPTFTTGRIRKMFSILDSSTQSLEDFFQKQLQSSNTNLIDIKEGFYKYTIHTIASCAFGVDSLTFSEKISFFEKMGNQLQVKLNLELLTKFVILTMAPKVGVRMGLRIFDKEADQFFTQVILDTMAHRRSSGVRRDDFLQLMMDAQSGQLLNDSVPSTRENIQESQINFDDDIIVANSIMFLLAGFDTTQSLLIFTTYQIALCPEVQEQLYQEVEKVFEEEGAFTYDNVNRMEYLDNVLNETLRMYPPGARLERRCNRDYQIPNSKVTIKKGQMVIIPTFSIHRDPEIYQNPLKFDPERFSSENYKDRHPYSFLPWGHGPRKCIAVRFAQMECKLAIVRLVHKFKFEPCAETQIPLKFANAPSLKPTGAIKLKMTSRNNL